MTERLFGDRPISHPSEDAFGLSSFAEALANSLLQMSPKDGLVISVEGPWGAGKSSAIALAVRSIKLRVLSGAAEGRDDLEKLAEAGLDAKWAEKARLRKTHIVRFNPWNFSGQENLVRAFFSELSAQIDVEPEGALKKAMNTLAGYLPSVAGGLVAGGFLATGNIPAAAAGGAVGKAAGEAASKLIRSESSLEGAKKKLAEALRTADQRIIIIIDDIDRLLPNEMRAIFSLVKSLGDLPNVLYVLSFDSEVVHLGLQQNAERMDPAFLEKIVQVSLKLPPPWREELRQLFYTRVNAIIGDAVPADQRRWELAMRSVIDPYLETPRDVTRLANTLQVIWPNVAGDVDLTDLIVLTTLQLFDAGIYALIRDEIEVITHADARFEEDKAFGKRMEPVSATKPDAAKDAMALMFPRLAKAWNTYMADGTYYILQKEQRRISTKEYHRNYFVFGRDTRMLSRSEVERLLHAPKPATLLKTTLKRLAKDDPNGRAPSRIASLLDQISTTLYANPLLTPALLKAILDNSDELIRRGDVVWELFVTNNAERLDRIVRLGTGKLNESQRDEVLTTLVNYDAGLQIRTAVVEHDARNHGFFGGEKKHESDLIFAADKIEAAAIAIRDEIAAACNDGSVWNNPMPIRLIWAWRRMSDMETLRRWFTKVLKSDEKTVMLANELPGRSYQSGGDGSRIVLTFSRQSYEGILDVDALFGRLETLARKNKKASAALARLRAAEEANNH
ncbi:P-loop NTPase fold protein [Mesorhizobium sp. VNQ89]|uniref:KAP family P-loop NTPase fold protein n=1 Tax=Mesorhizobium quangtriensis TaxID=3157709 RepID=UPI0032B728AA